MFGFKSRAGRGSLPGIVLFGFAVATFAQAASAEDGDFFSSMFSGGRSQPAPAMDQMPQVDEPDFDRPIRRRPLTVKLHRPKVLQASKPDGKPVKVSILEDRTLRRGDAVMTAKGIRIFAGSTSWPYRPTDFVAISDAGKMDGRYQKVLLDLDKLPSR